MKKMIAPSVLSADSMKLGEEIRFLEHAGMEMLHIDIMDGSFVPNLTFGPKLVGDLNRFTDMTLDVHMMVNRPDDFVEDMAKAGANIITVHYEAVNNLFRTVQYIRSFGVKAGVSINPATPLSNLECIAEECDLILIMTVEPGFGGQSFIEKMLRKIEKAREMIDHIGRPIILEADGGINELNIKSIARAGTDAFVVGNGLFGAKDRVAAAENLKKLIE